MLIIHFPNGTEWYKANWVFRQFRTDIAGLFAHDLELITQIECAEAWGLLPLESIDQGLASRIIRAMRTVAQETVDGKIQGWLSSKPMDIEGQRMYVEAISELLDLTKRQSGDS